MCCDPSEELFQPLHPLAEELIAEVVKVLEQLLTREGLEWEGGEGRRGEGRGGRGNGWEESSRGKGEGRREERGGVSVEGDTASKRKVTVDMERIS